jgi:hypothetical protein
MDPLKSCQCCNVTAVILFLIRTLRYPPAFYFTCPAVNANRETQFSTSAIYYMMLFTCIWHTPSFLLLFQTENFQLGSRDANCELVSGWLRDFRTSSRFLSSESS